VELDYRERGVFTFKSAYTSGMLSISPSGRRITPWYLSEKNKGM